MGGGAGIGLGGWLLVAGQVPVVWACRCGGEWGAGGRWPTCGRHETREARECEREGGRREARPSSVVLGVRFRTENVAQWQCAVGRARSREARSDPTRRRPPKAQAEPCEKKAAETPRAPYGTIK